MAAPRLSIVMVVFDMPREAPRTLGTLQRQRDCAPDDYEVIVVENGSTRPLPPDVIAALPDGFHYLVHPPGDRSPVAAMNRGIAAARGDLIGLYVDGARLATPGLIARALEASRLADEPVIATLGFHLGPVVQVRSIADGYDAAAEDALLASVPWEADGYELFRIATLAESCAGGWFRAPCESNALFLRRHTLDRLGGGMDPRFDLPGGGYANHDVFRRACELDGTTLITLLGEATFHQVHGGIATNRRGADGQARMREFSQQYRALRGGPVAAPSIVPRCYGTLPPQCDATPRASVDVAGGTRPARLDAGGPPIPVVLCVDLECDERHPSPVEPTPWRGYEASAALLGEWRARLAAATGRAARFSWFHRMDPAVAQAYGVAEWSVVAYPELAVTLERSGDAMGLHFHPARWDEAAGEFFIDDGDPAWVEYGVRESFAAFRRAFGRDCRLFRSGDRYLDARIVGLLQELAVRVDLTPEPGLPPRPIGNLEDRRTGVFPEYDATPRAPYQPAVHDFRDAAPAPSPGGLWMMPVSTGAADRTRPLPAPPYFRAVAPPGEAPSYVRLGLWDPPWSFARVVEQVFAEAREVPLLVSVMRSSHAIGPQRDAVARNLDFLARHPLARRFVFTTPEDALALTVPHALALDGARDELRAATATLETIRAEHDWVVRSRSWRFTAPARRVLSTWRGR